MAVVRGRIFQFALSLLGAGVASFSLAAAANSAELCWDPAGSKGAAGEGLIHKSVRNAFVAFPEGRAMSAAPVPDTERRVIRRVKLPAGQKLVALTFDLCEQPNEVSGYQGEVVDYLRENQVRATFFVGGKWLLTHRTRAEQLMTERLFEVGNHSWEHRNLRLLSGQKLADEIDGAQMAYEQVRNDLVASQCVVPGAGKPVEQLSAPRMGLFRFPYGACDQKSLEALWSRGLKAVQWDLSSGDPTPGLNPKTMARAVVRGVRPGSIVLFHANGRGFGTGQALPSIVRGLREKGYRFVTVSELLAAGTPEYSLPQEGCYDRKPGDTLKYDQLAARLEVFYQRSRRRVLGKGQPLPVARRLGPPSSSTAGDRPQGAVNPQESGLLLLPSAGTQKPKEDNSAPLFGFGSGD